MNFRMSIPEEESLPRIPLIGAVFIGVGLGGIVYYLIHGGFPLPAISSLPIYLSVWFWAFLLYISFQFRNRLLQAGILILLAGLVVKWIGAGYHGSLPWLAHSALNLVAGVLFVAAGIKVTSLRNRIVTFLLFVGFFVFRYWTISKVVKDMTTYGVQ
jgi:hypothetical protein